jgi:hypothetical protein
VSDTAVVAGDESELAGVVVEDDWDEDGCVDVVDSDLRFRTLSSFGGFSR